MIELQILYCVGVGGRGRIDFSVSCFGENLPHFFQIKLGRNIQYLKGFKNYVTYLLLLIFVELKKIKRGL